jgi:hypothetical protein
MNRTEVLNLNRTLRLAVATLFATLALAVCTVAHAAPPAGTPIGNQASATYLDATATSRTVTLSEVTSRPSPAPFWPLNDRTVASGPAPFTVTSATSSDKPSVRS